MKIIKVNTMPDEPDTVYVAVEEFPDVEFRIPLKEHNTVDKLIRELRRRVEEHRARYAWGDQVLLEQIKALIGEEV